ncbi:MAG TPA: response regulator transcription factor [Elusimicrobiota bacterium]|nr:response regulator transcription factor [Elusimicrobiota bacterium]
MSAREKAKGKGARILIVDDHPIVRQGLAQTLEQQPGLSVCGGAADAAEALRMAAKEAPDLVITDLSLGEQRGGLELIKELLARLPGLPVLVLSMHDESFYAERALRAGAKGYIMKQEPPERVVEAVRRVLRGEIHLSERTAAQLLTQIAQGPARPVSPVSRLSDRELQVFKLIGAGYATRQIAQKLSVSSKTVETHRQHIKEKLRLSDSTALVRAAIEWARAERAR